MSAAVVSLAGADVVRPREPAVLEVTVSNVGSEVEAYDLTVLGPLAPFATVAPPEVRLLPGEQATALVTVGIGTEIVAGPVPFAVRVQPRSTDVQPVIEERELEVAAVAEFGIRPVPLLPPRRRWRPTACAST